MSLRDFNTQYSDDPIALHTSPVGNGGGLDNFHTVHPEDSETNNTPKILGALAVALMIGAAGVGTFVYSSSPSHPKAVVTASNLPASLPAAPAPVAATAPDTQTAMTPAASPEATPAPAPMRTASAKPARSHASVSSSNAASIAQPQQQAVVIPEPVAPSPSPSDVATNNAQSAIPAAPAATASDVPAAPVQEQQSVASPAPAQSPAQSAGQGQ
jgi:hypothetical protein